MIEFSWRILRITFQEEHLVSIKCNQINELLLCGFMESILQQKKNFNVTFARTKSKLPLIMKTDRRQRKDLLVQR